MISGASSSISFLRRVFLLITRRYKSFTSETANFPPSKATKGRKSGGKTGRFVIIIHSGRFGTASSLSVLAFKFEFKKFSTTFKRLMMVFFLASEFVAAISSLS